MGAGGNGIQQNAQRSGVNGVLDLLDTHERRRRVLAEREKDGQAAQGAIGHIADVEANGGRLPALLKELDEPTSRRGARLDSADAGCNRGKVLGDPVEVSSVL